MRTRRSVRNQNILWRELGGQPTKPPAVEIRQCWKCKHYPKAGRNRGECKLTGKTMQAGDTCPQFEKR